MSNDNLQVGKRFIEFSLGEEDYGLPLLTVREVISPPETTIIPNSPSYYVGIMNLRGQVITILDLRKKLGIKPKNNNKEEAVIIVSADGVQVGLVVDSINKVLEIESTNQIANLPDLSSQVNAKFILGVYKKESSLTIFLNIAEILDLKSITKTQNAVKAA